MRTWQGTRFLTCLSAAPAPVRPDFWKGTTMAEDSSLYVMFNVNFYFRKVLCSCWTSHPINKTLAILTRVPGPFTDKEREDLDSELKRACTEFGDRYPEKDGGGRGQWLWSASESELRRGEGSFLQLMIDYNAGTFPGVEESLWARVRAIIDTILSLRDSPATNGTEARTPNAESETQPGATDDNGQSTAVEPSGAAVSQTDPAATPVDTGNSKSDGQAATKKKRSTQNGEAKVKLIAALTEHHGYARKDGWNETPIGSDELARKADVGISSASRFFKREFDGHTAYMRQCANGKLIASLRLLNGDVAPRDLDGKSPWEHEQDDE